MLMLAQLLIAALGPQPTHGPVVMNAPFEASRSATVGVTTLRARTDLFASLRGAERVVLSGVALDPATLVDLELEARPVIAPDAVLRLNEAGALARPDVVILGGEVSGEPGSLAYLALSDGMTMGVVVRDGRQHIISSGPAGAGLETVVFDPTALPAGTITWFDHACAALGVEGRAPLGTPAHAARGAAPCRVADVAIETDTEFRTALFGGSEQDAADYAAMLVGAVSEIYERDANVRLSISFLRIWTTPDPWTMDGGTVDQLFEFQDYWNATMSGVSRSSVHMLSGRPLGGGVAYVGGLCFPDFDYALSANLNGFFPYPLQNNSTQNWDMMVTAHEWGHLFGAPHTHEQFPLANVDECGNGDCSAAPNGTIMSYCHLCGNGTGDVRLEFDPQTVNSWILAYLSGTGQWEGSGAQCDLTGDPLCDAPSCLADVNGDGAATPADFSAWISAFNAQGPGCDQNGDGACTPADFSAWIANYNAGC
jgi:hypothetical protein